MIISFVSKRDSFEPGSQVHVLECKRGIISILFLGETKNKWLFVVQLFVKAVLAIAMEVKFVEK